jgi:hypothetical protein
MHFDTDDTHWIARPGTRASEFVMAAFARYHAESDLWNELSEKVREEFGLPEFTRFWFVQADGLLGKTHIATMRIHGPRKLLLEMHEKLPGAFTAIKETSGATNDWQTSFKRNAPEGKRLREMAKGYPCYLYEPREYLRDLMLDALPVGFSLSSGFRLARPALVPLGQGALLTTGRQPGYQWQGWEQMLDHFGFDRIGPLQALRHYLEYFPDEAPEPVAAQ